MLLAPQRVKRPLELVRDQRPPASEGDCPLCEGNEERTPPELYATRPEGGSVNRPGWSTRVVPNKFPLLAGEAGPVPEDPLGHPPGRAGQELLSGNVACGSHEVIVHTPEHKLSLVDLSEEEMQLSLSTWVERMRVSSDAHYMHLIVNEGAAAGASLAHSHAQLLAMPFVPPVVARERERFAAYFEQAQGGCLLCDVLQEEVRLRERLVEADDDAVLIAPFASRLPYQLQIVPRKHSARFEDDGEAATAMLTRALSRLSEKLGGSPPLNLWVRTAPKGAEHFHWQIEIVPRLTELAGVELGVDVAVNTVSPEDVAATLSQ